MELDKIKQVTDIPSKNTANDLLEKGWVLLDAKVVQLANGKGRMGGGQRYILGRPEEK